MEIQSDLDEVNEPEDRLAIMLIFSTALHNMLKENEGIVVKIEGDMNISGINCKNVIVYRRDGMVRINEADDDLEAGRLVWMHEDLDD